MCACVCERMHEGELRGQRRISALAGDVNAFVVSSLSPAAKPLHHHGQECLRLRVDVVAADGEFS